MAETPDGKTDMPHRQAVAEMLTRRCNNCYSQLHGWDVLGAGWNWFTPNFGPFCDECFKQAAFHSSSVDLSALWGLVDEMRVDAMAHHNAADHRDDPYDDVGYEHRTEAHSLQKCADLLAYLLPPRDTAGSLWQPIETLVKGDATVVLRPHRIWGPMDVKRNLNPHVTPHPWVNGDLTTSWPEEAFLPYWMPLPAPPRDTEGPKEASR